MEVMGFANEINIPCSQRNPGHNKIRLESAWQMPEWAEEHSAIFEPEKRELTYYTKKKNDDITNIGLGKATVQPRQNASVFGI